MSAGRVLLLSNRLPLTVHPYGDGCRLGPASGGLASGLGRYHEEGQSVWIGWPGETARFTAEQRHRLDLHLRERAIVPVYLSQEEVDRYYHDFSNRVLWPLFHYQIDRVPVDATGWEAYAHVNEAFAEAVSQEYRRGDTIWIHDYQLLLLPAMVRRRLPHARIGFFLHIPFPSSEVFRILPWRQNLLHGMLGADLIGFHTFAYMRHFLASLLHVDGVEADVDRVRVGGRTVRLGAYPMGVDAARFSELALDSEVVVEADEVRREANGRHVLVGIDRLDYTKGIPRRLQAIERLLLRDRSLSDRIRYIQVAVPSRGEVESYQRFKRLVEERVGRINGVCGTLRSTPVHYINRSISMTQLVALFSAADVMLVTPLRDGMNLVAKEFVASRVDEDGVLILSEFAGAAAELHDALVVNPYDIEAVANSITSALAMPTEERQRRMRSLRRRVMNNTVQRWSDSFLCDLMSTAAESTASENRVEVPIATAVARAREASHLELLLDYDGTLVPLAPSPELAPPDPELLALLEELASAPNQRVHIVSGRPRDSLDTWFSGLSVSLWAEHGFWSRPTLFDPWRAAACVIPNWMDRIRPLLEEFTRSTPGAFVEQKSAGLAWHYRLASPDFGRRQAHELRMLLGDALSNQPFEVLEGKKVIEVRLRGVSKAVVAYQIHAEAKPGTMVIAIGDERTDDDLFRELPATSLTIGVGDQPSHVKFRVRDSHDVRMLLRSLVTSRAALSCYALASSLSEIA